MNIDTIYPQDIFHPKIAQNDAMQTITIRFLPADKSITVPRGTTILEAAQRAGVILDAPCGGRGRCGKCLVLLRTGAPAPSAGERARLSAAQLKSGFRLACLAKPRGKTEVETLAFLTQAPLLAAGSSLDYKAQPPAFADELVLALDVGTTSIAAALYDPATGQKLAAAATLNTQLSFGADLMSRLNYCLVNKNGSVQLSKVLLLAIKGLIIKLCRSAAVAPGRIRRCHAVGNTVMLHFFLSQDPRPLATYPFTPSYSGWADGPTRALGLDRRCQVRALPYLDGFVGADCLGVILATGIDLAKRSSLAIDIGTNSEIILAAKGRLLVASSAAGPALEGGNTSCGMRAAAGAIDSVRFKQGLYYNVIGGGKPKGLCGSGLIDLLAALRSARALRADGLIVKQGCLSPRVTGRLGKSRLQISTRQGKHLSVTQQDIRQLQLAKGAIGASALVFMEHLGISASQLDRLYLAGAFGNYLNAANALKIGLLPDLPLKKIQGTGNAALDGAALSLLAKGMDKRIARIVKRSEHLELNLSPRFQDLFAQAMSLGPLGKD
jgi:uncharacterized 2Fe-2S/4Fe-4S cluster protein (DUF4445 family)